MDTSSEGVSIPEGATKEDVARRLGWAFTFFRLHIVAWVILSAMLFYFALHLFQHFWNFYVVASANYKDALKAWTDNCDSGNYMPEIYHCHEYRAIVYSYPLLDAFASTLKDFLHHLLDVCYMVVSIIWPSTYFGPICAENSACRMMFLVGINGFMSNTWFWTVCMFALVGFWMYLAFTTKDKVKTYRLLKKIYNSAPRYRQNPNKLDSVDESALAQSIMHISNHLGQLPYQSSSPSPSFPEVARKLDHYKTNKSPPLEPVHDGLRSRPTIFYKPPRFVPVNDQ